VAADFHGVLGMAANCSPFAARDEVPDARFHHRAGLMLPILILRSGAELADES
jgi:hypothetical protein